MMHGRVATIALGTLILVHPVAARPQWLPERAAWLQRNTAAAANGVLGLTDPWWRADCKLVLASRSAEQRARVYALSAVRDVEPDAAERHLINITFDPQAPLGRVQLQSLLVDRERVIAQIRAYASTCGATLTSSSS